MRKRKKSIKMRGAKTHGYGSEKKHRGRGSRGGGGMAGSKTHKRFKVYKENPDHIGKSGFHGLKTKKVVKSINSINLRDLQKLTDKPEMDLELFGFDKVLGSGHVRIKLTIKAKSFSAKAEEKITKAGGKVIKPGQ